MNDTGVSKYIIGTILAAISLLVIYGASASNRVASWVDGSRSQANLDREGNVLAQTNSPDSLTPLQQAGELPQRQTVGTETAEPGDEISVDPLDSAAAQGQDTGTPAATPAPTETPPAEVVENPEPVRALW